MSTSLTVVPSPWE